MTFRNRFADWRHWSCVTLFVVGGVLFSLVMLIIELPTIFLTRSFGLWGLLPSGILWVAMLVWYRRWKAKSRQRCQTIVATTASEAD